MTLQEWKHENYKKYYSQSYNEGRISIMNKIVDTVVKSKVHPLFNLKLVLSNN